MTRQVLPSMLTDRERWFQAKCEAQSPTLRACACGYLNRKTFWRFTKLDILWFEVYTWLIADPRYSRCLHENLVQAADARNAIPVEQAYSAVIPLA